MTLEQLLEESNKEIKRKNKVYFYLDSLISLEDRLLVYEALEEIERLIPMCEIVNMDISAGKEKEMNRKVADSFLKRTFNEIGRANGNLILDRLQKERDSLPDCYAVVLITAYDLYLAKPALNWCFGAARIKNRVNVQSIFRYQSLSREEKVRCIRRTLRHELGHNFGMASDLKRVNTVESSGPHCTAPGCSMRQAGTLQKLLESSAEEERIGYYYCKDCISDMNKTFKQYITMNKS